MFDYGPVAYNGGRGWPGQKVGIDQPPKSLPLPVGLGTDSIVLVMGGPYRDKPPACYGVKLDDIQKHEAALYFPIPDFGLPGWWATHLAVTRALRAVFRGRSVYVGCGFGHGRTGMFMSLMAKACGIPVPIGYVRQKYSTKAVETWEQIEFIVRFPVGLIRLAVFPSRVMARFRLWMNRGSRW